MTKSISQKLNCLDLILWLKSVPFIFWTVYDQPPPQKKPKPKIVHYYYAMLKNNKKQNNNNNISMLRLWQYKFKICPEGRQRSIILYYLQSTYRNHLKSTFLQLTKG